MVYLQRVNAMAHSSLYLLRPSIGSGSFQMLDKCLLNDLREGSSCGRGGGQGWWRSKPQVIIRPVQEAQLAFSAGLLQIPLCTHCTWPCNWHTWVGRTMFSLWMVPTRILIMKNPSKGQTQNQCITRFSQMEEMYPKEVASSSNSLEGRTRASDNSSAPCLAFAYTWLVKDVTIILLGVIL